MQQSGVCVPTSLSQGNKFTKSPSLTTILVVDDEPIIRELCAHTLHEYRILQAESCEEALRLFTTEQVDLILTDITMPGESGIDLLKQVKILDPNATVIIATGVAAETGLSFDLNDENNRKWIKADTFLEKGIRSEKLKLEIDKLLKVKA